MNMTLPLSSLTFQNKLIFLVHTLQKLFKLQIASKKQQALFSSVNETHNRQLFNKILLFMYSVKMLFNKRYIVQEQT